MKVKLSVDVNGRGILLFATVVISIAAFSFGAKQVWDGYETHRSVQQIQQLMNNYKSNKDSLSLAEALQAAALGMQSAVNPNWQRDLEEEAQKEMLEGLFVCAVSMFLFFKRQAIASFFSKFVSAAPNNP